MNSTIHRNTFPTGLVFELVHGDISVEPVEAIVNAANAHLQHGGGVAGIISRRGGPTIQAESDTWVKAHGPIRPDQPAYTGAGQLPYRFIIHAVGPIWGEGDEDTKLAQAVTGAVLLADQLGLASVSLPAISTGIYGFPKERAAGVILSSIAGLARHPFQTLRQVRLVIHDEPSLAIFRQAFLQIWADGAGARGEGTGT